MLKRWNSYYNGWCVYAYPNVTKFFGENIGFSKRNAKIDYAKIFFYPLLLHFIRDTCDNCCLKHTWVHHNFLPGGNVYRIRYLDVPLSGPTSVSSGQNTLCTGYPIQGIDLRQCWFAGLWVPVDYPRLDHKLYWFSYFNSGLKNFHIS